MNRKIVLAATAVLVGAALNARAATDTPEPARRGASAAEMAPPGFKVLKEAKGDLNGDGWDDIAFVLENRNKPAGSEPPRCLVVALHGRYGTYHLAAYNWRVLAPSNGGGSAFGDPLLDLDIEKGNLVVAEQIGSSDRTKTTCKYKRQPDGKFRLIGKTTLNYNTRDLAADERDENLLTGYVIANNNPLSQKNEGRKKPPQKFYALRCVSITAGDVSKLGAMKVWPCTPVNLKTRERLSKGAHFWQGASDLSARLEGAYAGGKFFLRANVVDEKVTDADGVRLRGKDGWPLKPLTSSRTATKDGFIDVHSYSLADIMKSVEQNDNLDDPAKTCGVTIDVVDSDRKGELCVMSTCDPNGRHSGEIVLGAEPLLLKL